MANQLAATGMGAGSGAATGALIGSAVPGIGTAIGAGAGALLGGALGFFGSKGSDDAANAQRQALDQAMAQLQQFSQQQYAQRAKDLQQTMSFYQPAQNYLKSIYGGPKSAAPPAGSPPVGTGTWATR